MLLNIYSEEQYTTRYSSLIWYTVMKYGVRTKIMHSYESEIYKKKLYVLPTSKGIMDLPIFSLKLLKSCEFHILSSRKI